MLKPIVIKFNQTKIAMKKIVVFFGLIVFFANCKKGEELAPNEKLIKEFSIGNVFYNYEYYQDGKLKSMILPQGQYYHYEYFDTLISIQLYDNNDSILKTGYMKKNESGYVAYSYMYGKDTTYSEYLYLIDNSLLSEIIVGKNYKYMYSYSLQNGNVVYVNKSYIDSGMTEFEKSEKSIQYSDIPNHMNFDKRGLNFYGKPTTNLPIEETFNEITTKFEYKFDNDDKVIERLAVHYNNNTILDTTRIKITYY